MTRFVHTAPVLFPSLEGMLRAEIKKIRKENPFVLIKVLLGSTPLLSWFRDRLAIDGYYMVEFNTLEGLVSNHHDEACRKKGLSKLPAGAMHLLLERFFKDYSESTPFSGVINKEGFLRALSSTILELKEAGQFVEKLLDSKNPKEKLLLDFLEYYDEKIKASKFTDNGERYWLASEEIESTPPDASILLCYGMYDFNYAQEEMLKAFFSKFTQVHFFLPEEKSKTYFLPCKTLSWLINIGFKRTVLTEDINNTDCLNSHPLEKLLLPEMENRKIQSKPRLEMFSSRTEIEEIEEIVRKIFSLCSDGKTSFRDVTIVLRSPSIYREKVIAIFEKNGIPFSYVGGKKLSDTSIFQGLAMFLKLAYTSFKRDDVMELLAHGNFDYKKILPSHSPKIHLWEHFTVLAQIIDGKWKKKLERLKKTLDDSKKDDLEAFIKVLDKVFSSIKTLTASKSVEETHESIKEIMVFFPKSKEKGELVSVLKALLELKKIGDISPRSFIYIFLDEAKDINVDNSGGNDTEGVLISEIMKFRGIGHPIVFIPGIGEKQFPKKRREDPIFPDRERRELIDRGINLKLKKAEDGEEELLFLNAVYSAERLLFLSYAEREIASSKEKSPSFYFIRAKEFIEESNYISGISLNNEYISEKEMDFEILKSFLKAQEKTNPIPFLMSNYEFLRRSRKRFDNVWSSNFSVFEGCLADIGLKAITEKLGKSFRISPTGLERYARCPYSFFLGYLLSLEKRIKPSIFRAVTPQERGTIYHSILWSLFSNLIEEKNIPITNENFDEVKNQLNIASEECFKKHAIACFPLIWEMQKREICEDILKAVELERGADSVPVQVEFRFGKTTHTDEESEDSTDYYLRYKTDREEFISIRPEKL